MEPMVAKDKDDKGIEAPEAEKEDGVSEGEIAGKAPNDVGATPAEGEVLATMVDAGSTRSSPADKVETDKPTEDPPAAASEPIHEPLHGDTVLHMDPPLETLVGKTPLPHLAPAPYVHHFDSYTLTQSIAAGGFTTTQSIETMKIVRALLTANLDMAKDGLVSKSDVENETYLFQAACSELRTEIQNARKASDERMRLRRTALQNEGEILNQKMTQDLATLKDELKEMFNDRKMEVRMEHSNMESAVCYPITGN